MLDFVKIKTRTGKKGVIEIYPEFYIIKSKDLMIRGSSFYAIWDDDVKLWCTDEFRAINLIDKEIENKYNEIVDSAEGLVKPLYLLNSANKTMDDWIRYSTKYCPDIWHTLDDNLMFSNMESTRKDYATKRLSYPLEPGDYSAYNEMMSVLYSDEERHKLEWAVGCIISGDSKTTQKFEVLYGESGSGKSTFLNIVQMLFDGYYSVFDARSLGNPNSVFALEAFKDNPLVAIQHDGDLSKIEDNTRLNSIVSHEEMTVNEKFKSTYTSSFKSFLFMGTNKPVKITDAKSGLLRRLIDVKPTGKKLGINKYKELNSRIKFELGGIATRCLEIYKEDPDYYDGYIPIAMLGASNDFYNFMEDAYDIFEENDGISLKSAWSMYKEYCEEAKLQYPYTMRLFREELKNYFETVEERSLVDGVYVRNYYKGFKSSKFKQDYKTHKKRKGISFELNNDISQLDYILASCPAQYANDDGLPKHKWENVDTKLSDINTNKLHYVKVPTHHIVIDFDLKDENGNKSYEKNLEAASKFPPTYAELSKSGAGIHLHYIWDGDPRKLSRIYDTDIEIKVFTGNSSLRRKLTKCNDLPIRTINTGLPLKGEDTKVVNFEGVKNEKALRTLIFKNLNKEIHGATKPSVDFIKKILNDAYASGMKYDVEDLYPAIRDFASHSSHQADACLKLVSGMKFKSDEPSDAGKQEYDEIIFYDVEVFPNLFIICWKKEGKDKPCVKMINPSSAEVEELMKYKLVGFNCRRYDNHILYARMMGYNNEQLYDLSQRIISGDKTAFFGEAYNVSYTDIYDFSSVKQSLKKFEIELGIHHQECGLPWDQPVPEDKWDEVADYCCNDVIATEAVFEARKGDYTARKILAALADMTVNDTTNSLTTRIIFGKEKHPKLVYTQLEKEFPGYQYIPPNESSDGMPHNMYKGEDVGFGGYVYAEPGMYADVALLDVASLHPHSIIAMNCFGEYTSRFKDLLDARMYIKHKEFDKARKMLNGKLAPYLEDESVAKDLAQALKIAINSVYGLTSAKFDNPFRDPRNVNNIVALRGALFMVDLKHEVQDRGFTVAHCKTDSLKVPNATPEIISFAMDYAKKYGYTFEHEATYEKMCLVNNAVYIAKHKGTGEWTATGTQFAVPYVFKTLFSKEPIVFEDLCETKAVTTALYLDMNEALPQGKHDYHFVGKVGLFCPIKPGCGGGELLREKEGKYSYATGAKGYRWLESEVVKELNKEDDIDISYYNRLVNDAIEEISAYGDIEWLCDDFLEEDFLKIPEGAPLPGVPF